MAESNSGGPDVIGTVNAATDVLKHGGVADQLVAALLLVLAVLAICGLLIWAMLWLSRRMSGNGKSEHQDHPGQSDAGAIMHALTGISREIAEQGRSTLAHIDKVAEDLGKRISDHDQRDDVRFDGVYAEMNRRMPPEPARRRT